MINGNSFWITMLFLAMALIVTALLLPEYLSNKKNSNLLKKSGKHCSALLSSYTRINRTQHRVVLLIRYPEGEMEQEFVLNGLHDSWLVDVSARKAEIQVIAHPKCKMVEILNN